MNATRRCLLAFFLGVALCHAAYGQDYIGYVEQLAADAGRRAQMHAYDAVQSYRQQTGDWTTPDQQVFDYLVAESRRQNPGFYADLQQRERAFQQQQWVYTQNSNAILDGMYNSYMATSQWQHNAHQQYVREGIWERQYYTNGYGNVYELPYYDPGNVYQTSDGSSFIQDQSGNYYQYDSSGWG